MRVCFILPENYSEQKILRLLLIKLADQYPKATYAIFIKFSMDDYLGSVKNPEKISNILIWTA